METAVANDYYWDLLKDLSDDRKVDLIDRLVRSLVHKSEEKKAEPVSASQFYGVWKDEDFPGMSADDMVRELREARTFKNDIKAVLHEDRGRERV